MKKNMPTTKAMLFFSWASLVLGVAVAARIYFIKGFTVNASFEGFFAVAGGLVVAVFLRMIAKIGQLVFDLKCDLVRAAQKMDQSVQLIDQGFQKIDQGVQRIDQGVQRIDQGVQRIDQGVQRIDQSTQRIDESARKTEEFLMKMKHHIETQ